MYCLCCGKPLKTETASGWHTACIRRFFGTSVLPELEIGEKTLAQLAQISTQNGLTVPGVQKKMSLHLHSEKNAVPRLTMVDYPTGYILKPQEEKYIAMPQAEQLTMCMADITGIATVPHALVQSKPLGEGAGEYAYITKRVDRLQRGKKTVMLAMEDFCQLDGRATADKYLGSYERCAKVVQRYSVQPLLDLTELYLRLVFCFVTGNSDMHLKNFSLIERENALGSYLLSPAYDLLPVKLLLPEDKDELALTLNGKKRNLRKKDFLLFAAGCGLGRQPAQAMIKRVVGCKAAYLAQIEASLLPPDKKAAFAALLLRGLAVLEEA